MSETKRKSEVVMNGLNTSEPFDHILKARAIVERVNSRLKPGGAGSWAAPTPDAPRLREAPPKIDPDLRFKAEPDGVLEAAWAAPFFTPSWAMPDARKFSDLDMDDYSVFQGSERPLPEPVEVVADEMEVVLDTSDTEAALFAATASPAYPADAPIPIEEAVAEEAAAAETPPPVTGKPKSVIELERTVALAASNGRASFRHRLGRKKAAIATVAAAALILLAVSLTLEPSLDGEINPPGTAPIVLNIDEDAPLVDLYIDQAETLESPAIELEIQTAAVEPEPPALEFITSEELLAEEEAEPVPAKKAASETYALDLELALLPEAPPVTPEVKPTILSQVSGSVKRIMASPTLATVAEELRIAPSAGNGDGEEDEFVPLEPAYTLSAFPDRLPVGRAADVVFTLKKDGQPLATHGLDIRFENNPAFPNLRDSARYPDEDGTFTVKGLKPGKAGVASLRLLIDDEYADAPLYIAAPGLESTVKTAAVTPPPSIGATEFEEDVAAPLPPPVEWRINPGLLRGQLEIWSARAGYQLVWEAKNDFEMFSQASFQDDYIGAVRNLFTAMHEQGNPLKVTVYQGNRVLKVTEE